jgi:hypothetical protein
MRRPLDGNDFGSNSGEDKKLQAQADALIAGIGNGLDDHTPTDGKARSDDCGY